MSEVISCHGLHKAHFSFPGAQLKPLCRKGEGELRILLDFSRPLGGSVSTDSEMRA